VILCLFVDRRRVRFRGSQNIPPKRHDLVCHDVLNLAEALLPRRLFGADRSLTIQQLTQYDTKPTARPHKNLKTLQSIDKNSFQAAVEHWKHEGEHSTSEFRFQFGRTTQDALFDAAVRSEQVRYRHVLFRLDFVALALSEESITCARIG